MYQTVTDVQKQKEADAKALEAAPETGGQDDLAATAKKLEDSQAQLKELQGTVTELQKEVADAVDYKSKVRSVNLVPLQHDTC